MKLFCLLLLSFQLFASPQQKLKQWTELTERNLLEKYQLINSSEFNQECIELAKSLEFSKISHCYLLDTEELNTYVLENGHVYFSKAMVKLLKNKHQWAFILAHENAHLELNHYIKTILKLEKPSVFFTKSRFKKFKEKQEQAADKWAESYLKKVGLDQKQIYYFLKRVVNTQGIKKVRDYKKIKRKLKKLSNPEVIDKQLIHLFELL